MSGLDNKQFAVIGDPIEHSLSPYLHSWVFDQLALTAVYEKVQVSVSGLERFMEQFRNGQYDGINVTLPHKQSLIPLLDRVDEHAEKIGAVNCVQRKGSILSGYNTDWLGISWFLDQTIEKLSERTCVLLGAGGVARSVLYTLCNKSVEKVILINRSWERALNLMESAKGWSPATALDVVRLQEGRDMVAGDTVIINCTPLGMAPNVEESPFPVQYVHEGQILLDTIYSPRRTQFLKFGELVGAKTFNGLDILIHQGLRSLDIWYGDEISQRVSEKKLKSYLESLL